MRPKYDTDQPKAKSDAVGWSAKDSLQVLVQYMFQKKFKYKYILSDSVLMVKFTDNHALSVNRITKRLPMCSFFYVQYSQS